MSICWHSITECLPETYSKRDNRSKRCLITYETQGGNFRFTWTDIYDSENDKWVFSDKLLGSVIAWAPMPNPWEECKMRCKSCNNPLTQKEMSYEGNDEGFCRRCTGIALNYIELEEGETYSEDYYLMDWDNYNDGC